ncbi:hypothetical protein AMTR_s00022p00207270 [Amborella trichopoda]|uniref:Uncharacterized protein n=1 Tax=Amborella trichopoda TaxID=13333 RepID=W1PVB7_AMBTC|nr:hypothetical protein AMTR_s00022p00207270 [Amborella trichopoda]
MMNSQVQAGSSPALLMVTSTILRPSCGSLGRLNQPGSWRGTRQKAGVGKVFALMRESSVREKRVDKEIKVKATATVKVTVGGELTDIGLSRGVDDFLEFRGKSVRLELVSEELDPRELQFRGSGRGVGWE